MEVDGQQLKKLEKDIHDIKDFLLGDEFHSNGIKQRMEKLEKNKIEKERIEKLEKKDRKREKRWWISLGAGAVILFLIKWGGMIIKILQNE